MTAYVKTWEEYAMENIRLIKWQRKHELEKNIERLEKEIKWEEKLLTLKKRSLEKSRTSLTTINYELMNEQNHEENSSEDSSDDSSSDSENASQVTILEQRIKTKIENNIEKEESEEKEAELEEKQNTEKEESKEEEAELEEREIRQIDDMRRKELEQIDFSKHTYSYEKEKTVFLGMMRWRCIRRAILEKNIEERNRQDREWNELRENNKMEIQEFIKNQRKL